jgi:hypothetical protein
VAWLDVYFSRERGVFIVDCQADMLSTLPTRFVIPIIDQIAGHSERQLNPIISFEGHDLTFVPQLATTMTRAELGEVVGSVLAHEYAIIRAIDILTLGV